MSPSILAPLRREREFLDQYPLSWRDRLYGWRRGFTARDVALLDLTASSTDPSDYLSSYQQYRYLPSDPEHTYRIENKTAFAEMTPNHLIPATVGRYSPSVSASTAASEGGHDRAEDIPIPPEFDGILKPIDGIAGRSVKTLTRTDDGIFIDQHRITGSELRALLNENIAQERIRQHDYSQAINPHGVNTIRIVTITPDNDRDSDPDPFVASAIHRFGTSETAPADNWSQGGVCAPISLLTGEMGAMYDYSSATGLGASHTHPESGTVVKGEQIPNWDAVLDTAIEVASAHAENRYVGWDIVIQENGTPVVLEGNSQPHLALQQIGPNRGLLADKRVRAFFDGLKREGQ